MNKLILSSRSRSHGFTLIELLVVIGIIAILASVIAVASGNAIRSAKRARAASTANQIQTSVLAYYTEYSVYPVPPGTAGDWGIGDTAASKAAWGNLIEALSGNISPYNPATVVVPTITNTRKIGFISLKSSDVDAGDAPLNPLPTGGSIYFNIAIDNDYDGILGAGSSTAVAPDLPKFSAAVLGTDPPGGGSSTAGVAVWANCNGDNSKNPAHWVHTY